MIKRIRNAKGAALRSAIREADMLEYVNAFQRAHESEGQVDRWTAETLLRHGTTDIRLDDGRSVEVKVVDSAR